MKKTLILLFICCGALSCYAQQWQWANFLSYDRMSYALACKADNNGNFWQAITFEDSVTMSPFAGCLVKYNAAGLQLLTVPFFSKNEAHITALESDPQGNIYLGGYLLDGKNQDTITIDNHAFISLKRYGGFLFKLNSSGSYQWSKQLSYSRGNPARAICFSAFDNSLMVCGDFNDTLAIDSYQFVSRGDYDAYIAKFDASGSCLWINAFGGTNAEWSNALAVDAAGNTFCAYYAYVSTSSSVSTYGTVADTVRNFLFYTGTTVMVKYDPDGIIKWIYHYSGQYPTAAVCNSKNELLLLGDYQHAFSIGSLKFPEPATQGGFVVKIDHNGNPAWRTLFDYSSNDSYNGLFCDAADNIYVSGFFTDEVYVDSTMIACVYPGVWNALILKFNTDGHIKWYKKFGGTDHSAAEGLSYSNGSLYVSGTVNGQGSIGAFNYNYQKEKAFFAKLDDCNPPSPAVIVNGPLQFCRGIDSVLLTSNITGSNYTYQWQFDGINLADDTTTSILVDSLSGDYSILVTDLNGCTGPSPIAPIHVYPVTKDPIVATNYGTACQLDSVRLQPTFPINGLWLLNGDTIKSYPSFITTNSDGVYSFINTNAFGCTDTSVYSVYIGKQPHVTLDSFPDICFDSPPITMQGGQPAGGEYKGTGITNNVFYPDSVSPGTYPVTYVYTDQNNCTDSVTIPVTVATCVGIHEAGKKDVLLLSPNPVTVQVRIHLNSYLRNKEVTIQIENFLGEVVKKEKSIYTDEITVNTNDIPAGIYFIRVEESLRNWVGRFVKE